VNINERLRKVQFEFFYFLFFLKTTNRLKLQRDSKFNKVCSPATKPN
jgi:hypothetical protein